MLTKLTVRNFKRFESAEIELGQNVVFVGPNNSGKSTALQALALWHLGITKWHTKRGGRKAELRTGVGIHRREILALPIPNSFHLWRDLHVRDGKENVRIEITVEGIRDGGIWRCGLEFDYANPDTLHCRPLRIAGNVNQRMEVPKAAVGTPIGYLPPMSGLFSNETRIDTGAINVRLGEGRTAEVLRNICSQVRDRSPEGWNRVGDRLRDLFGVEVQDPIYISERGEIEMEYKDPGKQTSLDLSAAGRGLQQTLLLLAFLEWKPGTVLLLDEPDAHLEILRQKQIYEAITEQARATGGQIIAASHSEVVLNAAAERDTVIAFVGRPHRIDSASGQRTGNVRKSLSQIRYDEYLRAEQTGWVLYVEGETDVAGLRAMANRLGHAAAPCLDRVYAHPVGNLPNEAKSHFQALRECKPDLVGFALFDNFGALDRNFPPGLTFHQWVRREIECYYATREALVAFADAQAIEIGGTLFRESFVRQFGESLQRLENAFLVLNPEGPWSHSTKITDEFLDKLFRSYYQEIGLSILTSKSDYPQIASYVAPDAIDLEVSEVLGQILAVASSARPVVE
jgi:predicted ATPase